MALDRVQPLKLEDTSTGGDDNDLFPTSVDRNEDYLDCRGLAAQNATSNDDAVVLGRDALNNMTFTDPVAGATYTLTQLTSGGFDIDNVVWDMAGGIVYDNLDAVVKRV